MSLCFRNAIPTLLILACGGVAASAHPAPDPVLLQRQAELVDALQCGNKKVAANTIARLVYAIGGHSPVLGADHSQFTWPDHILVLGEEVDRLSITSRETEDGRFFTTAVALPGEDLTTIAERARMSLDIDGIYRRWNGPNELLLQAENGVVNLVCTPNANSWRVRVRRFFRETFRGA